MSETILVERRGRTGIITLNRPDVLNAVNRQLREETSAAIQEMESDDKVLVLILTGQGRAFCAGADIHEQVEREQQQERPNQGTRERGDLAMQIASFPKPVVAAINGVAVGFGSLLATSTDWRFGCAQSRFRFPGVGYGRINATWSTAAVVGLPKAKDLILSGRWVEAEEAYRMGLLDRLLPHDSLLDETVAYAEILAKQPPEMVRAAKRLLNGHIGLRFEEMYRAEREAVKQLNMPPASKVFEGFLSRSSDAQPRKVE